MNGVAFCLVGIPPCPETAVRILSSCRFPVREAFVGSCFQAWHVYAVVVLCVGEHDFLRGLALVMLRRRGTREVLRSRKREGFKQPGLLVAKSALNARDLASMRGGRGGFLTSRSLSKLRRVRLVRRRKPRSGAGRTKTCQTCSRPTSALENGMLVLIRRATSGCHHSRSSVCRGARVGLLCSAAVQMSRVMLSRSVRLSWAQLCQ